MYKAFLEPPDGDNYMLSRETPELHYNDSYFADQPNIVNLRKLDQNGHVLWLKSFSSDSAYYPTTILDTGDGLLIGGCKYDPYSPKPDFDIFLYKLDYYGNFLSAAEFPGGKVQASLYPNPGNEYFFLKSYDSFIGASLEVRDLSGRLVHTQTLKTDEEKISASTWNPGVYTISVIKNKQVVYAQKWVKQ